MPPAIDLPKLQEIRKKIKELPKVERVKTFTGPEALEALRKDIMALSRKGYDSKEIAKILKREGLAASSAKVKKLLADDRPENDTPADDRAASGDASAPDPSMAPDSAASEDAGPSDDSDEDGQSGNEALPPGKTVIRRPAKSNSKSNIQEVHQ